MLLLRKFRWPIVVFLTGLAIKLLGAWLKITHQTFAEEVLSVGFFIQIVAVFLALCVVFGLAFGPPQEEKH